MKESCALAFCGIQYLATPIGFLRLAADKQALCALSRAAVPGEDRPNAITRQAAQELEEYFAGKRRKFTVALSPRGTPFRQAVWAALARIPYGRLVTYGMLATAIGRPTACRAVANAVGKNPLMIFLPCHRVVASNGLGGFSAGLDAKRLLLQIEDIKIIAEKTAFEEKFFFTFPT